MSGFFDRSESLLGEAAMTRLAAAHVLVVGVGGVGSWCAEALVRTGLGHVTLVDDDVVAESNVNRQCPATALTVGRPKVEAMAERLKAINPACEVAALAVRFPGAACDSRSTSSPSRASLSSTTSLSSRSSLSSYDLVIDAIDSIDSKATLILAATEAGVPLVSSMGAALRLDPTQVRVTRFEKVVGDGLARALRQRFKRIGRWPKGRFSCVWSGEAVHGVLSSEAERIPLLHSCASEAERIPLPHSGENQTIKQSNNQTIPKGSLMPVTATFGMCLASEAIRILTTGEPAGNETGLSGLTKGEET